MFGYLSLNESSSNVLMYENARVCLCLKAVCYVVLVSSMINGFLFTVVFVDFAV